MFVIPFGFFGQAGYDDDAQAFFDAVEGGGDTLTDTEKTAVNDLVVDLKAYNIWENFVAFYPYVGGTSTSTKWNLKDPRDLDAAGRINWYGTITFTNGVQGNGGSTSYGWTNLNPSTHGGSNQNYNFGGYTLSISTANGSMMGVESPGTNWAFYDYFNGTYMLNLTNSYKTAAVINSSGLYVAGAFSNTHKMYRNGSNLIINDATAPNSFPNQVWTVLGNNTNASEGSGIADCSSRSYSFHFLYDGSMSTGEIDNFYTAATSFNSTLSR